MDLKENIIYTLQNCSIMFSIVDYSNTTLYNDTEREELEDYKADLWHSRIREVRFFLFFSGWMLRTPK